MASSTHLSVRPSLPRPNQGVGESGRPRVARNHEIAGSNPAALTTLKRKRESDSRTRSSAVEQRSFKPMVAGSIPAGSTTARTTYWRP